MQIDANLLDLLPGKRSHIPGSSQFAWSGMFNFEVSFNERDQTFQA